MDDKSNVIVVGVDGTETGDEALRFACEEARVTGAAIEVVTVWSPEPYFVGVNAVYGNEPSMDTLKQDAQERQDAALARVVPPDADLAITRSMREGLPGTGLVDAAAGARMLVVGSRSIGAFTAAVLGSVSRYCAHHASCPVVVVPAPRMQAPAQPAG